ncbi:hypothetical protein EDB80DRAFT_892262 [Ilyonectria destructans]|nr:hypothetical protein EDB80DRAFT_892262 [Ilyonectria destructans]
MSAEAWAASWATSGNGYGAGTGDDNDYLEKFRATVAVDCGDYWLCENLDPGDECRIIWKSLTSAQLQAAPTRAQTGMSQCYPKRFSNLEKLELSVMKPLTEFPILPKGKSCWKRYMSPGPVRAIYQEGKKDSKFDIIYHDPTKPLPLDFAQAKSYPQSG